MRKIIIFWIILFTLLSCSLSNNGVIDNLSSNIINENVIPCWTFTTNENNIIYANRSLIVKDRKITITVQGSSKEMEYVFNGNFGIKGILNDNNQEFIFLEANNTNNEPSDINEVSLIIDYNEEKISENNNINNKNLSILGTILENESKPINVTFYYEGHWVWWEGSVSTTGVGDINLKLEQLWGIWSEKSISCNPGTSVEQVYNWHGPYFTTYRTVVTGYSSNYRISMNYNLKSKY